MTYARVGDLLHFFIDGRLVHTYRDGDLARLAETAVAAALHDKAKT